MAVVPLCTLADMQDRLSAAGVTLRADDNPPDAYGNAISRGSVWVYKYLTRRYPAPRVDISQSEHARMLAADIATFLLCTRRGNPAPVPIAAVFKSSVDEMKEIRAGQADLYDVAAQRQGCPVLSNVRVTLSPQPHVRVSVARNPKLGGVPSDYSQVADLSQLTEMYLAIPMGG